MMGDDYKVLVDVTENGVRHIIAEPSGMVCSKRIGFSIVDGRMHGLEYLGGCHGNLQAVGRLLEGMPLEEVAAKLRGVDCHGRGTSCTDQLARIVSGLI